MEAPEITSPGLAMPEVTAALIDLAKLAKIVGIGSEATGQRVADRLLERLLALCSAQRGAIFLLTSEEPVAPEPSASPRVPDRKGTRVLAMHRMHEEEASSLLSTSPSAGAAAAAIQATPDLSCWIMYHVALDGPAGESSFSQSQAGMPATLGKERLHVQLVLGWDGLEEGVCARASEQGHKILPFVADAVGAVIVSLLQAERIQELEKTAEREALRGMELLKAELLATISHELRSPLASIKGYAATLLRHERRLSREERHQFLLAINEASDRLELIIERLLEMSQLDTGAISIQRSPVDMARLVQEALIALEERVNQQAPGRFTLHLQLETLDRKSATTVPLIQADRRRLREVLDNVLENAITYSPQGGTIRVLVRPVMQSRRALEQVSAFDPNGHTRSPDTQTPVEPPQPMLELCISDTGMGIPAGQLGRIFDRFHRVDMRLTRETGGLGLGLAICKRIVELHDGSIWAESSPGEGSAFHVLLPIDEPSTSVEDIHRLKSIQ